MVRQLMVRKSITGVFAMLNNVHAFSKHIEILSQILGIQEVEMCKICNPQLVEVYPEFIVSKRLRNIETLI